MNFKILIPFWGENPRYIQLLKDWFDAYWKLNLPYNVVVITDYQTDAVHIPGQYVQTFNTPEYNPEYQFDHKGDLVCAAIQKIVEPVLVLDSDAVIRKDFTALLETFLWTSFAMPADEGCLGLHIRNRHAQPTAIAKRCAGVLWFGIPGSRAAIVEDYRTAFKELETGRYYEERRLFEQHAWTMVAHKYNAPMLPRTMNWLDNNSRNGPNPDAFIYHRIGQRKFNVALNSACV